MMSLFPKITLWQVCLTVSLLTGCQILPSTPHLPKSVALTQHAQNLPKNGSRLQQTYAKKTAEHAPLSGYYPISTGADAFAARTLLSDMASHSIDVQYYIWHNDEAGQLMLKDLWRAAERGVIVRLLLDDMNGSSQLDDVLIRFASHPNISVRLVNPVNNRRSKLIGYLSSPLRINARMHNKSITFDGSISIIGGRNIGNEYLNNDSHNHFADLDVLLIGDVVKDIKHSFESYWASPLSYDIDALTTQSTKSTSQIIKQSITDDHIASKLATSNERALHSYRKAVQSSTISKNLLNQTLNFRWAKIEFMADPVAKLQRKSPRADYLVEQLKGKIGQPVSQVSIISSYFVPTKEGVDLLVNLAKQGVKIHILTNSFDATDVGLVHSGYAHWRHRLLSAGVQLYEFKSLPRTEPDGNDDKTTDENRFWRNKVAPDTSLHAKVFAVDGRLVFIGSYNFDPRSANINTELGVLIHDDTLAKQLHHVLSYDEILLNQSYKLVLDKHGNIQWHTIEHGKTVIYQNEPKMSHKDKAGVAVLSLLPIDWLL